jgi:hypothetical protein
MARVLALRGEALKPPWPDGRDAGAGGETGLTGLHGRECPLQRQKRATGATKGVREWSRSSSSGLTGWKW